MLRLAALAEAVAELRQVQQRAAQAAAALRSAQHLHAAAPDTGPVQGRARPALSPAALADASFPSPPRPDPAAPAAPAGRRPAPRAPASARRRGR
jgi:hypothetical protein